MGVAMYGGGLVGGPVQAESEWAKKQAAILSDQIPVEESPVRAELRELNQALAELGQIVMVLGERLEAGGLLTGPGLKAPATQSGVERASGPSCGLATELANQRAAVRDASKCVAVLVNQLGV